MIGPVLEISPEAKEAAALIDRAMQDFLAEKGLTPQDASAGSHVRPIFERVIEIAINRALERHLREIHTKAMEDIGRGRTQTDA